MTQNTPEEPHYFDLHARGIGYLNRIREVQVRRGPDFMACDIAALHGPADDVQYTRFDCKVSGAEAERLVRRCWDAVNAQKKVLVSFRISDLWTDPFLYEKGDKAGQPGASLKARLLYLGWIKIDGQLVYKAEPRPQEAPASASALAPAQTFFTQADALPCVGEAPPQPAQPQPTAKPANRRSRNSIQTKAAKS
jgi:hypothetical protein